ncbi:DUF6338 family protein [Leptospira santarosai]|uniref:DUF6338 family protein n=1 Tax=Leptospira santarosai TaxID=28183 RepID=UPI000774230D|nr:DUF6338 family protein [Leptospira santarosai]
MAIFETLKSINLESLVLALLLVFPGLLTIKVSKFLAPQKNFLLSEQIIEAAFYTILNYFVNFWAYFAYESNLNIIVKYILGIWVFLLCPSILPFITQKIKTLKFIDKYLVVNSIPKPWDFFFSKRNYCWVIIHLKNGKKIGGFYGPKSFSSSFPNEEQLYLEEVWSLEKNGKFKNMIPRTKGIIINMSEITSIEFKNT